MGHPASISCEIYFFTIKLAKWDKCFYACTIFLLKAKRYLGKNASSTLLAKMFVKTLAWEHSVEISLFSYHSDFTWNQIPGFEKYKICHFNTFSLRQRILIFMNFCTLWKLKFTKSTKFRAPKSAKKGNFRIFEFCKLDFT